MNKVSRRLCHRTISNTRWKSLFRHVGESRLVRTLQDRRIWRRSLQWGIKRGHKVYLHVFSKDEVALADVWAKRQSSTRNIWLIECPAFEMLTISWLFRFYGRLSDLALRTGVNNRAEITQARFRTITINGKLWFDRKFYLHAESCLSIFGASIQILLLFLLLWLIYKSYPKITRNIEDSRLNKK